MSAASMSTVLLVVAATLMLPTSAKMFLSMDTAQMKEFVEDSLMKELAGAVNDTSKIRDLETKLRPLFKVAPQNADNTLPQASVMDVLNQFFLQRGWFVVGLQPETAKQTNSSNKASQGVVKETGAPMVLLNFLEQLHAGRGTKLREVAVLAATLEDLAHAETDWNMRKIAAKRGLVFHASVEPIPLTAKEVDSVLDSYMLTLITGKNFNAASPMLVTMVKQEMKRTMSFDWDAMNKWISDIVHEVHPSGPIYIEDVFNLAQELGKRYGYFKDKECGKMKSDLLGAESNKAGRIRLADFYDKGRTLSADAKQFNERLDYLKALGAIDESDPKDPLVIVPNYITSRPQCKAVTDFLTICCRSECVDIVGQLEHEVGKDRATPEKIVQIVSTSLAGAPRKLSVTLVRHLYAIAERHNGEVPIHGRLFAQWMHHAFPRECPLPSVAASRSTQTPEEWSETTGVAARLSEEEVLIHIDSQAPDLADSDPLGFEPEEPKAELPWLSLDEEMMGHSRQAPTRNSVLKRAVVLGMLASMAWAAKSLVINKDASNDVKMV